MGSNFGQAWPSSMDVSLLGLNFKRGWTNKVILTAYYFPCVVLSECDVGFDG